MIQYQQHRKLNETCRKRSLTLSESASIFSKFVTDVIFKLLKFIALVETETLYMPIFRPFFDHSSIKWSENGHIMFQFLPGS